MDEDSDGVIRVEHVNKVTSYFCFIQCCGSGIRMRRSRMFLGLLDPDLNPEPDTYLLTRKNNKKNLDSYCFWLYDFFIVENDVNVPSKVICRKTYSFLLASWRSMTKIAESWSGSIVRIRTKMSRIRNPVFICRFYFAFKIVWAISLQCPHLLIVGRCLDSMYVNW